MQVQIVVPLQAFRWDTIMLLPYQLCTTTVAVKHEFPSSQAQPTWQQEGQHFHGLAVLQLPVFLDDL
jgi:hypothetical protein